MGLYQYDSTEDKLNLVAGSTNFSDAPVGAIFPFGGTDIPISFLLCDGSAVSRTDYAELFAVIGINFGEGDGETTFGIPDLRECVPVGVGKNITQSIAAHDRYNLGQFKDDQVQEHTHTFTTVGSGSGMLASGGSYNLVVTETTSSNSGRSGTTTHGKQLGVNYIIKAKQIGMPTDFASEVGDIAVDKNTYSTSETIVGKWIDGKPIYRVVRHVWDVGNVPATGYSFSGTMLSGPLTNNAESFIRIVILCKNTQGRWQELTGNGENGPSQNFVWFSDTSAYFIHSGTLDGAWAIFEYTKTTDG